MTLPFSPTEFFGVFAEYNRLFWLVVIVLWLVAIWLLVATSRNPARYSRALMSFLSVLWAWNAAAYHFYLFARINPAAWLFGAFFILQAMLLLWAGRRVEFFTGSGPLRACGTALALYSLAYPFLSAVSHTYPATATFGVPCPTAILTIGLLLTVHGGGPRVLLIVPTLWGLVGGSAAVLLGVPSDYVLLGAGLIMLVLFGRARLGVVRAGAHSA